MPRDEYPPEYDYEGFTCGWCHHGTGINADFCSVKCAEEYEQEQRRWADAYVQELQEAERLLAEATDLQNRGTAGKLHLYEAEEADPEDDP